MVIIMKKILLILIIISISGCKIKDDNYIHAKLSDEGSFVYGSKDGQPERYQITDDSLYYKVGANDYIKLFEMEDIVESAWSGEMDYSSTNKRYTIQKDNIIYAFRNWGANKLHKFILNGKDSQKVIIQFDTSTTVENVELDNVILDYIEELEDDYVIFNGYIGYGNYRERNKESMIESYQHFKCSLIDYKCERYYD